jgi:hypothetical protein
MFNSRGRSRSRSRMPVVRDVTGSHQLGDLPPIAIGP